MAAYLVGARGTARHAIGLGLSVTVSHTVGIAVLAGIVFAAGNTLPPDVFGRWAPLASALLVLLIGGWLVAGQLRAATRRRASAAAHDHAHAMGVAHAHDRDPELRHGDGIDADEHVLGTAAGQHRHGPVAHQHLPADLDRPITWRSLAVLGLAGGIIPSTNALLVLLAAIATGRPAWGIVLVVAFGLGMAAVLAGIGLVLVRVRGWRSAGRLTDGPVGRLVAHAPALGAVIVLALGAWLTTQPSPGSVTF